MANFNLLKGYRDDLNSVPLSDGTMYLTVDDGRLYIDDRIQRLVINAYRANVLGGVPLPEVPSTPIAANIQIPYTWEEINLIAISGHAQDWISVGAIKTVMLNSSVLGTTIHDIRVIGINQDNSQSITFQTKNCLANPLAFSTTTNIWTNSDARVQCQNYYNAFPYKNMIVTVSKGTATDCNNQQNNPAVYTNETVWLPSEGEMGLSSQSSLTYANSTASNAECTQGKKFQYSYYTSDNNRLKALGDSSSSNAPYWCRSLRYDIGQSNGVCRITKKGAAGYSYYSSNSETGLAPAFVIGNPNLTSAPSLTVDDIYPYLVSHGGSIGQVLTKTNNGFDWQDATGGGSLSWGSFTDLE